jgi:predicted outer membrane protein
MKTLMHFFLQTVLCGALLCCITCERKVDSAKESAEIVNKKVFNDDKESRVDAQFIVDALDQCYGILEIARLGRTRGVSAQVKDQANQIVEGQEFLIQELQNYSTAASVSVPLNGPEKTNDAVKKLYKIESDKFDEAWTKQVLTHTRELIHDFEHYELYDPAKKSNSQIDKTLEPVIEGALTTLRAHEELLTKYTQPTQASK